MSLPPRHCRPSTLDGMEIFRRTIPMLIAIPVLGLVGGLLSPILADQTVFHDKYTSDKFELRKAVRGPWRFENGIALCTQDDEIFKKNKDHGPVLWYNLSPFRNAEISFSIKPHSDVKNFVFTINSEKGHAYRFVSTAKETSVRAYPANPMQNQKLLASRDRV